MASSSRVPVIKTLAELRAWRREKRDRKQEVGVVPTVCAVRGRLAGRDVLADG